MKNKNLFGRILHGCAEVSQLIVRESDEPLSLQEQIFAQTHFLFCKCCRNFSKESRAIDVSLETYFKNKPTMRLSESFKQELQKTIDTPAQ